jgi:hypothetical protein
MVKIDRAGRRWGGSIGRCALVIGLILVASLGLPAGGRAEDDPPGTLNLWPIYDDRVDPLDRARDRSGLGPVLWSSRSLDGDIKEYAVRPLFFWREEVANRKLEWDFLYPLMSYRRLEGDWEFQFIHFLSGRGEGSPQAGREEHRDFFPFYFSGVRENGEKYFGVLPFWGKAYDRFFGEEWEWVMFPLYARFVRSGTETQFFPWPFISVTRGVEPEPAHRGFRVVPLYGQEVKEGVFEKYFALWPLFLYQRTGLDGDEPEETLSILPFYVSQRSPKRDSTTILWPIFTYTDDRQQQYEMWDVAWPFFKYARGEGRQTFRLLPFYMDDHKILRNQFLFKEIRFRDRAVLYPLYVRNEEEYPDSRKVRDRILWYLYSDAREDGRDGSSRRIDAWPFFLYERDREGAVRFQALALLEGFMPANEWVERSYSPLWSIYTYRANAAGESVYSFLWNLLRHEETNTGLSIEVLGPLLTYREAGEDSKFSLLGGLFQYEAHQGERSVRLFGNPLVTWTERVPSVVALDPVGGNR